MITVSALHKSFGGRALFRNADLRVGPRERVAVVGPNGAGKTTLFEMIAGLQAPDSGAIDLTPGIRIGYLPQETDAMRGRTVLEEVLEASTATEVGRRLVRVREELSEGSDEGLLRELGELQSTYEGLGGYGVDAEAKRVLAGLGFRPADVDRPVESFSGGWQMRVALAKLLLAAPDLLLLDEPTNHLDLESVTWLERFLASYDGTVLLISHDRDFMNALVTRVIELDAGALISYTGDYEAFVRQRAERIARVEAAARTQARKIAQTEEFIERFRYKNTRASLVQSRIKALSKLERVEAPSRTRKAMKVAFPDPPRSGRVVVELQDVSFSYGDVPVYEGLSVAVERGERVALVGPNGAGKTTLLKLIAAVLEPTGGQRHLGHNVSVGYFAQHALEALVPTNRVIEELERVMPPNVSVRPRDLLGRFLFSGDDVDKPVSVLSGGERTRLAMAKLLVSPANLLCLDEPTNHLDVQSRDVLEDALTSYSGAIVLITHDRHLIRSVANVVVEVRDGTVYRYPGDYESFLYHVAQRDRGPVANEPEPARTAGPAPARARRDRAAERARAADLRRAIREVEDELGRVHADLSRLSDLLADPVFYGSGEGVAEAVEEHERSRARLAELEERWESLTEELGE